MPLTEQGDTFFRNRMLVKAYKIEVANITRWDKTVTLKVWTSDTDYTTVGPLSEGSTITVEQPFSMEVLGYER